MTDWCGHSIENLVFEADTQPMGVTCSKCDTIVAGGLSQIFAIMLEAAQTGQRDTHYRFEELNKEISRLEDKVYDLRRDVRSLDSQSEMD